jgi:hypothetical protein
VLMRLDGFYEVGCLYQTLMCTSQVKPCPRSSTFRLPSSR